ncbi:hypothetical protein MYSI104531_26380 [Mycobacterium simiae]
MTAQFLGRHVGQTHVAQDFRRRRGIAQAERVGAEAILGACRPTLASRPLRLDTIGLRVQIGYEFTALLAIDPRPQHPVGVVPQTSEQIGGSGGAAAQPGGRTMRRLASRIGVVVLRRIWAGVLCVRGSRSLGGRTRFGSSGRMQPLQRGR